MNSKDYNVFTDPRVKSLEFYEDGCTLKHVEFHPPAPVTVDFPVNQPAHTMAFRPVYVHPHYPSTHEYPFKPFDVTC